MDRYICNYISEPINVDGDWSKPEWKTVNRVNLVDVETGKKPKQETTAMLLWNENFLYAAFECIDYEIIASMKDYNEPLYNEDVVEIFIDDDNDKRTYIEIEANPNNAVLHYAVYNNGDNKSMYARVEQTIISAVKRYGTKIFYEIAIPSSEFINEIKEGNVWRFNLYRIDRGEIDEYTALSPTGEKDYHRPDKFIEIEFIKRKQDLLDNQRGG